MVEAGFNDNNINRLDNINGMRDDESNLSATILKPSKEQLPSKKPREHQRRIFRRKGETNFF